MEKSEKHLKELIICRYGSLNRFCDEIGMPWTTLDSILKRGVLKANITNVLKITRALGIPAESLAAGDDIEPIISPSLSSHEQEHIRKYREIGEDGRQLVDNLTDTLYWQKEKTEFSQSAG